MRHALDSSGEVSSMANLLPAYLSDHLLAGCCILCARFQVVDERLSVHWRWEMAGGRAYWSESPARPLVKMSTHPPALCRW